MGSKSIRDLRSISGDQVDYSVEPASSVARCFNSKQQSLSRKPISTTANHTRDEYSLRAKFLAL